MGSSASRIWPFSTGRSYINFQTADEDKQRIRATYGANIERALSPLFASL